jgi:hypothetical protein
VAFAEPAGAVERQPPLAEALHYYEAHQTEIDARAQITARAADESF